MLGGRALWHVDGMRDVMSDLNRDTRHGDYFPALTPSQGQVSNGLVPQLPDLSQFDVCHALLC